MPLILQIPSHIFGNNSDVHRTERPNAGSRDAGIAGRFVLLLNDSLELEAIEI
jgi:hypothetical protein